LITQLQTYYLSPLGDLLIQSNGHGISVVSFLDEAPAQRNYSNDSLLQNTVQQLDEYFKGTRTVFNLTLAPEGTPFQQSVWKELQKLKYASTSTYLQIAKRLGNTKSIRAAASANGKNPIAIIIPCHRVIGAYGKLTGYTGGLHRKKWLLEHEVKVAGHPQLYS
jgi:methylated-DNA-[protein]-cysteine S-methyltransferase